MASVRAGVGPPAVLQPRLPSHGLHHLLRSLRVRLAIDCSIGPLCCSLSPLTWVRDKGLLVQGLNAGSRVGYVLSFGRGVHAAFHVGVL